MDNDTFTRTLELEAVNKRLSLCQQKIGEVNCVVWDAALVLAKYLDTLCSENRLGVDWLRGKKVLELGAGLGCVGMTAACLGAHVMMTDLENALPFLMKNMLANENEWSDSGGSTTLQVLDWGSGINIDFDPDIILLADCVYYKESIGPLITTLEYFCKKNRHTYAILSQEERDGPTQKSVWQEFSTQLREKFHLEHIPLSEQHSVYSSEDIHLIKLKCF